MSQDFMSARGCECFQVPSNALQCLSKVHMSRVNYVEWFIYTQTM